MSDTKKAVFEVLKSAAMEKNVMSGREAQIISMAMINAITFDDYLQKAKKKGIIDQKERDGLIGLLDRIYEGAMKQAIKDDFITPDECILLIRLSEFLETVMEKELSEI